MDKSRVIELIKQLRKETEAGILDCKVAIESSNGDIEQAREIIARQYADKLKKLASRETKEGFVLIASEGRFGVIFRLSTETEPVATMADFISLAERAKNVAINNRCRDLDQVMKSEIDGQSIADEVNKLAMGTRENINLNSFDFIEDDAVVYYSHSINKVKEGLGPMGVLLGASTNKVNEDILATLRSICIQALALSYMAIDVDLIPIDIREAKAQELKDRCDKINKSEEAKIKIYDSMMQSWYSENLLMRQKWLDDEAKTVENIVKECEERNNASIKINKIVKLSIRD